MKAEKTVRSIGENNVWCVEQNEEGTCVNPRMPLQVAQEASAKNGGIGTARRIFMAQAGGVGLVSFSAANLISNGYEAVLDQGIQDLTQWNAINQLVVNGQVLGQQTPAQRINYLVDYLRGQPEFEDQSGTAPEKRLFRDRVHTLGDITESTPAYIGSLLSSKNVAPGFTAFKTSTANNQPIVVVGANDGMLHAFNANTGDEVWAFLPSAVIPNLPKWQTKLMVI